MTVHVRKSKSRIDKYTILSQNPSPPPPPPPPTPPPPPPPLRFKCEEADVLIKHIGGYPGHYDRSIAGKLYVNPPQLFISGHSHILKVVYDRTLGCLHINPGAAGLQGWHQSRTLVRFVVDGKNFRDLEVVELGEELKAKQRRDGACMPY